MRPGGSAAATPRPASHRRGRRPRGSVKADSARNDDDLVKLGVGTPHGRPMQTRQFCTREAIPDVPHRGYLGTWAQDRVRPGRVHVPDGMLPYVGCLLLSLAWLFMTCFSLGHRARRRPKGGWRSSNLQCSPRRNYRLGGTSGGDHQDGPASARPRSRSLAGRRWYLRRVDTARTRPAVLSDLRQ